MVEGIDGRQHSFECVESGKVAMRASIIIMDMVSVENFAKMTRDISKK